MKVAFVEPKTPGNIGAIARAMANFDLKELILVNPQCDHVSKESLDRAKHAKGIVENALVVESIDGIPATYKIATTGKLGADYNLPRIPLTPTQLKEVARDDESSCIIIGREGDGLTNEEILKCDFVVNIPTSDKYPILNASHAAVILFYELYQRDIEDKFPLVNEREKQIIMDLIEELIVKLDFTTEEKRDTQRKLWKRILGKSFLSQREAMALIGFLKKLLLLPK